MTTLPAIYAVGDLEIDEVRGEVRRARRPIILRTKPFRLLLYLLRHRERLVSKEELFEQVWPGVRVSDAALASALADLRKAIGDEGRRQRLIVTRRGRGYRWAAAVEERPAGPIVAEGFVGREEVVAGFLGALRAALAGRGRLLLLTGEAGIGKTRCAEEFVRIAASRGAHAHFAWCQDGGGAPAYWPWRQILASLAEAGVALGERVARRLSGLRESPGGALVREADEERFLLFDELVRLLQRAAEPHGLMLVIEDLQWADASSLALLGYVVRELPRTRILLVGTARDTELPSDHRFSDALAELARTDACTRIGLRGLARAEVRALVGQLTGTTPDESQVDALLARTDGNPFLLRESCSAQAAGAAVPPGIVEVIRARLRRLSQPCREALALAAALGGAFTCQRLATLVGSSEGSVAAQLDEARAADIVREVPGRSAYRFAHDLIREAVEAALPGHERARIHRRIGEALEKLSPAQPGDALAELARHFDAAGDAAKAADYATRAGLRALEIPAREVACAHFERALAALDRLPSPDPRRRCQLLRAWGWACIDEGRPELWRPLFREAAELADGLGDAEALADAARGFSAWVPYSMRDEEGARLLERAASRLGTADSPVRVRVLSRLAHQLEAIEGGARVDAILDEAEAIAERIGEAHPLLWVAMNRAWVLRQRGVPPELYLAATQRALDLAEAAGERNAAHELHVGRIHAHLLRGDLAAAEWTVGLVEDATRWSESYRAEVERYRVRRSIDHGRLAEAEARIDALERRGRSLPPFREPGAVAQRSLLSREQGRTGDLAPALEWLRTREGVDPPAVVRAFEILALAELDRGEEARVLLREVATSQVQGWQRPLVLVLLAEACHILVEGSEARRLYEPLLPLAAYGSDTENGWVTLGATSRLLGQLATLIGRFDAAVRHCEEALAFDERLESPLWQAYDRVALARALDGRGSPGDREGAFALATGALTWARERQLSRLTMHAEAALAGLHADLPRRPPKRRAR